MENVKDFVSNVGGKLKDKAGDLLDKWKNWNK
eukprot:CAMPEP_0114589424 /NCGR_PEP_ID=MMETSP0125-20121206/11873_1 /TAXON_ID=485358 ORGANISM="Aristerostoma sp., Strain ATCC 50986" /NCGR_SAMPLE_ID=MMETSP0125 /ASSEMBLY_ACC=CAM_ASM_000245 /LENGTH=31 /DNA_ID= /DNA_START= /DNA_END= /DNA_ORIENTATION=